MVGGAGGADDATTDAGVASVAPGAGVHPASSVSVTMVKANAESARRYMEELVADRSGRTRTDIVGPRLELPAHIS
jgi:hypothetical protein